MASTLLHAVPEPSQASGPSLAERLERGEVLYFEPGRLVLPPAADLTFLRDELGELMTLKNISYHPEGDFISGIKREQAPMQRTVDLLREHNLVVQRFLGELLPEYAQDWSVGKVNIRPLQEQGRSLSRHSSNELLHVDAFASGATHGDRILRFFTNLHPVETRVWKSAGLFPGLFEEFGGRAGIDAIGRDGLRKNPLEKVYSAFLLTVAGLGLKQALVANTSPYDRAMRKMHDYLKDDADFQADASRCKQLEFPPFSSWAVMTDMVSHAVVSGQHALVNTFYVRLERCQRPELAPFNVIAGR